MRVVREGRAGACLRVGAGEAATGWAQWAAQITVWGRDHWDLRKGGRRQGGGDRVRWKGE